MSLSRYFRDESFLICFLLFVVVITPPALGQFDPLPQAPPLPSPTTPPPQAEATPEPNSPKPYVFGSHVQSLEAAVAELRKKDPNAARKLSNEIALTLRQYQTKAHTELARLAEPKKQSFFQIKRPETEVIQQMIARVRDAGGDAAATQLEARLEKLKLALEKHEFEVSQSDAPEIHRIVLNSGATLPKEYRTKKNRFQMGFAEVHLKHTARPIILVLTARAPILWKFQIDQGVRVHAVVLDAIQHEQKLVGLENVLVLNTFNAHARGILDNTNRRSSLPEVALQLAGGKPRTRYSQNSYGGDPIVLGPENDDWVDAYLGPESELLYSDARRALRLQQVAALRELRFTSTFHNSQTDVGLNQMCSGEFTLAGPIASSMQPLPDNSLTQTVTIQDDGDDVVFGLSTSGHVMTVTERQGITSQTRVPLPPHLFKTHRRIQAMSYDAKRHRLLLATAAGTRSEIVAFDIEESEWAKVHVLGQGVVGMTYVPEDDAIWAVVSQYSIRDKSEVADFVVLDGETGEARSKKRVSHPLRQPATNQTVRTSFSVLQNSQAQLIASEGRAVLVATRGGRHGSQPISDLEEIFVIDSKDGTLLYSGPAVINDGGDPLEWIAKRDGSAREAIGPLGELAKKFALATDAVEQLGDAERELADELAEQLKDAKAELEGNTKVSKKPRLYLVGRYGPTPNQIDRVHVTDTSAPVILALCGQQAMEWHVSIAEGVKLQRIIAAGNVQQKVLGAPDGVQVDYYSGQDGFVLFDRRNPTMLARTNKRLAELTDGLNVTAMSLAHRLQGTQNVGPLDGAMRFEIVHRALDRILQTANASNHRDLIRKLERTRFHAIHHGPLPRGPAAAKRDTRYWNEFSIRGPLIGRSVEISNQTNFATQDPESDRLFLLTNSELTIRDRKNDQSETVNLRQKMQRLGQVTGLAFDSKRDRLLVDTSSGLFALRLKDKAARPIRNRKMRQEAGFAYSENDGIMYAAQFGRSRSEVARISRYNQHGAVLSAIELSQPFTLGQYYGSGNTLQIIDLGEHLALIQYQRDHNVHVVNGRQVSRPSVGRVAVVELATGAVVHRAKLQPMLEPRDISETELSATWTKLGEEDLGELDSLMWDMAAGGDATRAFLSQKYSPNQAPLGEVDIALLLEDLDHARFSTRDDAFKKLQAAGSAIEPVLTKWLKSRDLSSEARGRLRLLTENWKAGQPQTSEERRQVRGLEVLSRIGSHDARQQLLALQGEQYPNLIRKFAKEIAEGDEGYSSNPAMQFQQRLWAPR